MATGYEVTVKRPGAARGEEVEVPGLGVFKNGSKRLVTPDEAEAFRSFNSRPVVDEDATKENGGSPVYVQELGPTVTDAFKGSDYIESSTVDMERNDKDEWVVKEEEKKDPPKPPTDKTPVKTPEGGDK